ncbi:MAG TPA: aldehyde dehydrogenase (NADP(+)) [Candidatus Acidoferrales bacterium]|nr:aldehyde dehydrogenase (NADP(+)) [Candidatus Acidoferrales bacterium]
MQLTGKSIIGQQQSEKTEGKSFRATNPKTGERIAPDFYSATRDEVNVAASLAERAFSEWSRASGKTKAAFLRKIAENIESLGDDLVNRASEETALPPPRIKNEVVRTCFQLRMFAQLVEEGSWVGARIDQGDPSRTPVPKPDMRSLWRPLGPVVVFGASNFPMAYSVAGGDTASAFAAGNPVIVKAHPAHPGTAEMVGQAIRDAARECHAPEGVFSLLFDAGIEVGLELVKHPKIKAVGFTGSKEGGRSLMDAAASRPEPIPVYAEMGSINPVFILPGAMKERGAEIAKGLHASVTLSAGQFCTKPGIVVTSADAETAAPSRTFADAFRNLMDSSGDFTLLTSRIHEAYLSNTKARSALKAGSGTSQALSSAKVESQAIAAGFQVSPAVFETTAAAFREQPALHSEIFGPATMLVRYSSREELLETARSLEGHLTATIHGTEKDLREYADLVAILESKVGRLIYNGYPTGLEVCHAVVHGGPYPATSDGRTTAVGSRAIYRFARLICYQNFPALALPDELKDENPLGIWRLIDGQQTREPLPSKARAISK